MSEVNITSITGQQVANAQSAQPAAQPDQSQGITVKQVEAHKLPPEFRDVSQPQKVEARVVEQSPSGEIRLQTTAGEIVVRVDAPLPDIENLVITILPGGQVEQLTLPAVETAAPQNLPPAETTVAQPALPPPLREGQIITAVVLPAPITEVPPETLQNLSQAVSVNSSASRTEAFPALNYNLAFPQAGNIPVISAETAAKINLLPIKSALQVLKTVTEQLVTPQPPGQNPVGQSAGQQPAQQAVTAPPVKAPSDTNLIQIIQAQLQAKITHINLKSGDTLLAPAQKQTQAVTPSTSTPIATGNLIQALAELTAQIPKAQNTALARTTAPAQSNLVQLNIIKTLPPGTRTVTPETVQEILQNQAKEAPASTKPPAVQRQAGFAPIEIGTVIGSTAQGQAVITTASQSFLTQTATDTPVGTQIVFQETAQSPNTTPTSPDGIVPPNPALNNAVAAAAPTDTLPPLPPLDPLAMQRWPALEEAYQVITQSDPASGHVLRNAIPSPTPRLVPTTLFFLAALRIGTVEAWLGDRQLSALKQAGRSDIIDRITGDFRAIARQTGEALPGEWRAISVPLLHDEQISKLQFYVRSQHDQETAGADGQASGKQTRFILNFSLSRIGPMQIDGLLHKEQLDVILRTDERLPADIRQNILQRYSNGIEEANMKGSLSFQNKGWIDIQKPQDGKGVVA